MEEETGRRLAEGCTAAAAGGIEEGGRTEKKEAILLDSNLLT